MTPRDSMRIPAASPNGALARFFHLAERGTTAAIEVRAGLATFMVMA